MNKVINKYPNVMKIQFKDGLILIMFIAMFTQG